MKRTKLNLAVDALLLLCIAAIAGIGLLMKYVLVPGYQRWAIYGRNVNLFLWGLDRHQWGTIHFVTGLVFFALLVLHIILHWPTIVGIYRRLVPNLFTRWIAAVIFVCITILLLSFSCIVEPEVWEQGQGKSRGQRQFDILQVPAERR